MTRVIADERWTIDRVFGGYLNGVLLKARVWDDGKRIEVRSATSVVGAGDGSLIRDDWGLELVTLHQAYRRSMGFDAYYIPSTSRDLDRDPVLRLHADDATTGRWRHVLSEGHLSDTISHVASSIDAGIVWASRLAGERCAREFASQAERTLRRGLMSALEDAFSESWGADPRHGPGGAAACGARRRERA